MWADPSFTRLPHAWSSYVSKWMGVLDPKNLLWQIPTRSSTKHAYTFTGWHKQWSDRLYYKILPNSRSSSTSNFVGARMYWAIELTGCYRHFNFDEAIWMGCWTPIHNPLSLEPTRPEFVIIKLQDTFETRFRFQQRNKFPMQHFREIREHETPCKAGSFFTPLSGGTSVSGDTWSRKRKSWIYKKLYVNLRSPKGETIWTSKTPLTEPQKMEVKTFTLNTVGHIRSNQNRTNLSATLPGWMCTVS